MRVSVCVCFSVEAVQRKQAAVDSLTFPIDVDDDMEHATCESEMELQVHIVDRRFVSVP